MTALPKTPYDVAAAAFLVARARELGVTQQALGIRARIPPATMGRYWRGDTAMSLGTFRRLLDLLQLPADGVLAQVDDTAARHGKVSHYS